MPETDVTLHLANLVEETGALVALYDPADRLRFANRAFRDAWFVQEGETPLWSDLMRRNFNAKRGTVILANDFESWLRSTQSRRGKTGFRAFETDLHDGRWLWMTETMQPDGWMLCIASDITSIRSDERMLRQDRDLAIRASQTDELTGVGNRRFVMSKLEDLLRQRGNGEGACGCIALLDIDHFKQINDRFGHDFGDRVLKHFAHTLQRMTRKTDILGRIGGEEFLLILPRSTPEQAHSTVDRMLETIRLSRPDAKQANFSYSFSAGVAYAVCGEDAGEVFRRADLALYASKLAGRDQVSMESSGGRTAPNVSKIASRRFMP